MKRRTLTDSITAALLALDRGEFYAVWSGARRLNLQIVPPEPVNEENKG